MFSFILKIKRRIKKTLKVQSESRQIRKPSVHSRMRKFLLLLLVSVLVGSLYPGKHLYDPLDMPRKGEIAREDVLAPFAITLRKSQSELDEEMEVVRYSVPFVVDYDNSLAGLAYAHLDSFFSLVESIRSETETLDQEPLEVSLNIIGTKFPQLSRGTIAQSLAITDPERSHQVLIDIYRDEIYKAGVLPDQHNLPNTPTRIVLVRRGVKESIFFRERILTATQVNQRLLSSINQRLAGDSIEIEYCYQVGRAFIKPNLSVNLDEYDLRLREELSSISNEKEIVNKGDIIVRSGSRISERQQSILEEMARVMRVEAAQNGWLNAFIPVLARILLVLAAFSAFYLFLYYFRREIFNSNPKLLALFMVFALQLFAIHLAYLYGLSMYLYPVAVLPIVVTILFDAEVGVLSTLALALLLGVMHRFNFNLALMTMAVGTVACLTSLRVRKRTDFFKILLSVAATYTVFIFVVENLKFTSNEEILTEIGCGIVSGAVSAFLAIGILPLFESLFGITTDITLLELSDMNHPLLKRLAVEAPGTYQHSMIVGNLSEAAAKAIGANSLLARVGTYYH
ncbi:MAG: HDIG domain-containing protein, partial [candidate division Zixibacteria bacterium]|nr:HDIG domain-containing protein [candidate division Zixibacteria bacterium]